LSPSCCLQRSSLQTKTTIPTGLKSRLCGAASGRLLSPSLRIRPAVTPLRSRAPRGQSRSWSRHVDTRRARIRVRYPRTSFSINYRQPLGVLPLPAAGKVPLRIPVRET
jgi:hypothetical protein